MAYNIYIDLPEYDSIKLFTSKYPDIETGGDLFGYWLDEYNCIIKLVVGPGKNVRRTTVSFNQDPEYVRHTARVALPPGFLQLQQSGQWHSHHKLVLNHPSGGDIGTMLDIVRTTMLSKQITIIVNIIRTLDPSIFDISIKPYLFKKENDTFIPCNLIINKGSEIDDLLLRYPQEIKDRLLPIYRYNKRYNDMFNYLAQKCENPEIISRVLEVPVDRPISIIITTISACTY